MLSPVMSFQLSREAETVLHTAALQPFVLSGLACLTQTITDTSEVTRALKHLRVSIDAPRPDFVHVRVQHEDRVLSFREGLALLPDQRLASVAARIVTTDEGVFRFDPAEAFAKVVAVYAIDWSNFMPYAPSVRAHFMTDPRPRQEQFLRAFLRLYEEGTDVTGLAGAEAAAGWLRSIRVCTDQHTLVLRPPQSLPALDRLEGDLREALGVLTEALTTLRDALAPDWHRASEAVYLSNVFAALTVNLHAPLAEVLALLHVPPPRVSFQVLAAGCSSLLANERLPLESQDPVVVAALPALVSLWKTLENATKRAMDGGW